MLQAFDRCKKSFSIKFNQTAAANHGKWPLRIQFQRFGSNFANRWPRWTDARLIEVHLHSKSFGGTLKWPLKGGSRLIQVTATAGLTVVFSFRLSFFASQAVVGYKFIDDVAPNLVY